MKPTLHILANPYGITDLRYRMEPFNIAVHKFITNMTARGWDCVHYGHELANVDCENVPVISAQELVPQGDDELFLHHEKIPGIDLANLAGARANQQLTQRCKPNDIVLCFYGRGNQPAVENLNGVYVCEPSIGYNSASIFAPYRVFTSYAVMHYYYGLQQQINSPSWFDAVIPNAFSIDEFEYSENKQDYLLYQGRVIASKGVDLAIQVAEQTGHRLIIAGTGSLRDLGYQSVPKHVEMFGYANAEQRKILLRDAKALIAPTYYIEPFGNMVVESLLSGTPVISSDWGGFVDTNPQGITGYRCRDFDEFITAVANLDLIKHENCRDWATARYSEQVVHDQFDTYLTKLHRMDFYHGRNIQQTAT